MSGRIIPLRGDGHHEVLALLPWYLTGRLEADEQAEVEAHLAACPQCQAEAKSERRLAAEVSAAASGAGDVERGWTLMRRRVADQPARGARPAAWRGAGGRVALQWRASPSWLRWGFAGQLAVLLLLAAYAAPILRHDQARYRALGAAPVVASANLVVIFRPDVTERALRQTLTANHARLVDGPTATGAYLLHAPAAERGAALARLRRAPGIELAEPVDSQSTDSGASP